MLNEEHKNNRMAASFETIYCYQAERDSFEENIADETWANVNVVMSKDKTSTAESVSISEEEKSFYQLMFNNDIASVRFRRLHCTACDAHIGSAPSQLFNMFEHPILRTLLCSKCHQFYGDGIFEKGDDATDMFCRWCANGGNLYCCSYCSNTFCYKCIKRNFTSLIRKKIEADEKWKCFVCNPRDLYTLRAVCWALLQHVHTVTRILKKPKNMNTEQIKEKMNLDESQCCPRRGRRRNKRKLESNSEEEDETYVPDTNGLPSSVKRKSAKKVKSILPKYTTSNGIITKQLYAYSSAPTPVIQYSSSLPSVQSFQQNELKPLLTQHKASKHEEATIQPSDGVVPSSSLMNPDNNSLESYDSNVLRASSYCTTIVNNMATKAYTQIPVVKSTPQKVYLPRHISSQKQNSYKPSLQSSANTMVSIPNSTNNHVKTDFVLSRYSNTSNMTLTPNIIELDSDSDDEPKIVEQRNNATEKENADANIVDISSDKVVPVALVSMESSSSDILREKEPLREISPSFKKQAPSFSEMMLPHSQELGKVLDDTKENLNSFFNLPENGTVKDIDLAAYENIKRFYQSIRKTVLRFVHIKDRIMREYNKWERSRKIEIVSSSTKQNMLKHQEDAILPLDMTCVNESDIESDCNDSEYQVMEPSEFIQTSNIVKNLFFEKDVVHRGIGDSALLFEDKETQVYDVVLRNYEKCISHPVLTKTNSESNTSKSALTQERASSENFGKYEEQFIFYLQHIEDHGIEAQDLKEIEDPDKNIEESIRSSLLCNSNPPSQNVSSSATSNNQSTNNRSNQEKLDSSVNSIINDEDDVLTNEISKNDGETTQIINSPNSDTKIQNTNIRFIKEIQEVILEKSQSRVTDKGETSVTLNSDDISSNNNVSDRTDTDTEAAMTETEEEYSVVDD